ncbi:uncharacterized protein LOC135201576 [Macrobrachium nipponense]|uniref:uncharacterized protein LOC135201576 n=1 Tax=Macrobrachium nipponense TaxID=159736 RepID=UPI0030C8AAE1
MKNTFLLLTPFILAWQKEAFSLQNGSDLEAPHGNSSSSTQHNITDSDSHLPLNSDGYVFKKCCPPHEIFSGKGCVPGGPDYVPSKTMTRLTETHFPQISWPEFDGKNCSTMLKTGEESTHWMVGEDNSLSVSSTYGDQTDYFYCVEDYREMTGTTESVAILCLRDVAHILPPRLLDRFSKGLHVGKCCPKGEYLSDSLSCVSNNTLDLHIVKAEEFVAANVTEIEVAGPPVCNSNNVSVLHYFPFGQLSDSDYADFDEDQTMSIFYVEENTLENSCIREKVQVRKTEYCIDYADVDNNTDILVLVCNNFESKFLKHQEKFVVIPVLLGFSCAVLLATVLFLVTVRVRRALYTVRKINTLAGRILLAYVMSYFLAFQILIIELSVVHDEGTCTVLSGALLFSTLAAFLWNTSISMESLVLTIGIRMNEHLRFLCYCLWSWGVAGVITAVALTLDYYRPNLPCSVITPRFGQKECLLWGKLS